MRRDKLIAARMAVAKSQKAVAEDVGVDPSTVGTWERGEATPRPQQRPALAESLGVTLQELHALLSSMPSAEGEVPQWLRLYLGMEQSATVIRAFEPYVVYGLLQTPDYASAIARSVGTVPPSDQYIEKTVELREHRQRRIHSGDLTVVAVQPEFALQIRMGDDRTMAAQLDHLAALAALPNVTIHVLPCAAGMYEALRLGIWSLMTHPWAPRPTVYFEGYGGARFISDPDETEYFAEAFDQAQRLAFSARDSVAFIEDLAAQFGRNA